MEFETDVNPQPSGDVTTAAQPAASNKRLSVERIYQKKSQLEHILLRPDSYIGSTSQNPQLMWIFNREQQSMVSKEINFSPGLYKIFDEILVNAADNKVRDPTMSCIRIDIRPEDNMIKIWNNGKGIPVVMHKDENIFVPTLIFGHLLTSSNYDDSERKVTGGRNGYGAKLCNIFSKKFVIETSCKEYRKSFRQSWTENMTKAGEPKIQPNKSEDFTSITFYPDLERFGMKELEPDIVALFERRAYDIAATTKDVKVYLNGERLPVKSFVDYVELYVKNEKEQNNIKVIQDSPNPRWQIAVAPSSSGFAQVSFVNGIATTKGGKHVDYIADQLTNKLSEIVKKKSGKSGVQIKPFQIRNHMWIFVNCLIENPTFDSQTKENMTLPAKSFGSTCPLNEQFVTKAAKSGIVESVMSWIKFKAMEKMDKNCHKAKHSKIKGIPKLDDANNAGTRQSNQCTLILTEGDSAKSLAVAGLGVVGRDNYGVFPLRGKLLNVRDAPAKQIMENIEINALIKILGLQYKSKYESLDKLKDLRYGKIMIMTDQDQDGSHIKGLIINFLHCNWPNLLRHNMLEEFITPIVKVFKQKQELSFYSLPEFEEWQKATPNWHTWRLKYYKGLGTSTGKEAKDYFSDMNRHRIKFRYRGDEDDTSIELAFDKNKVTDRKSWLTGWSEERKQRREMGLPDAYLYGKDTRAVSYHDFVHKELVLFSNLDNERSIPSLVDGFKPGQRKVLFTCLKRNLVKELKVAQLAGSVAELSAYHHGEASLLGTIVGLAQNFVGSNNLNLLLPIGQFGTRLNGGKDAASPRYIFTALSPLTRLVFHPADDPILNYLYDDNQRIEPDWYAPIVPMVLINGAEGIGTGYSTKIPNFDFLEVVKNLYNMIDGNEIVPMLPSYRGFNGVLQEIEANRYMIFGEVALLDEETVEITELPIRTWTQSYKESVLEPMLNGSEKVPACILDYKEYHTDATVRFVVKMSPAKLREAEGMGLHKFFKIATALTTNSMVLFDQFGCLRRYESIAEIFRDFYALRLAWYVKRKTYLEGMLAAEAQKLENQARFLLEKIQNEIVIENKPKRELIKLLSDRGYASDPVRAWRECTNKLLALEEARTREAGDDAEEAVEESNLDYNYILGMPLWSLTKERKDDLLKQRDAKQAELKELSHKTPAKLWREDLNKLEEAYRKLEIDNAAYEKSSASNAAAAEKKQSKLAGGGGRNVAQKGRRLTIETRPDPLGRRIEPSIDPELLKKLSVDKRRKADKVVKQQRAANGAMADNGGDAAGDALNNSFGQEDDDDDIFGDVAVPRPLAERLSSGGIDELPSAPKPPAGRGGATAGRGTRGTRGARGGRGRGAGAAAATTKPRAKARKPAESDSSHSEQDSFISNSSQDNNSDSDTAAASPPKTLNKRQMLLAASKSAETTPDKGVGPSSSNGAPPIELIGSRQSSAANSPAKQPTTSKPAAAAAPKPKRGGAASKGPARAQKAAKPAAKRRHLFDLSSDDDDFAVADKKGDDSDSPAPVDRAVGRRAVVQRAKAKYVFDESESDEQDKDVDLDNDDDDDDDVKPTKKRGRKDSSDEDFNLSAKRNKNSALSSDSD